MTHSLPGKAAPMRDSLIRFAAKSWEQAIADHQIPVRSFLADRPGRLRIRDALDFDFAPPLAKEDIAVTFRRMLKEYLSINLCGKIRRCLRKHIKMGE